MDQTLSTTTGAQLAQPRANAFAVTTLEQVKEMAGILAEAQMYGLKKPAQFISLMMLANEEQTTLARLMQRVHVFEDGKLSNRADWLQAEFEEKAGRIIWHTRTDAMCVATFILGKEITDEQRARANKRFELLVELEAATWLEQRSADKERKLQVQIGQQAKEGEETVIRTLADADDKTLSLAKDGVNRKTNWQTSPRSMLQWRCVSEGVKVVCPRILSGMPIDIEYREALDHQRHQQAKLQNAAEIAPEDRAEVIQMIEQYDAQLQTATGRDRQRILGLRNDLSTKLADSNLAPAPSEPPPEPTPTVAGQPAKEVDTVVLPPEKHPQTEPKPPRPRRQATPLPAETTTAPAAAPAEEDKIPMSWKDVECHIGTQPRFKGRTLGAIFSIGDVTQAPKNEQQVDDLLQWFGVKQAIAASPLPQDKILWRAVQEGAEARKQELAKAAGNPTGGSTTAPAAQNAATAPASAQDWRNYVVPGKHPDYSGKKLGDLTGVQIADLRDNYLAKIDWAKATLEQKTLKAKVSLAIGAAPEPEPKQPESSAATEVPNHTRGLREAINGHGWHEAIFLTVCKMNGWCSESHRTLDDITEEEAGQLDSEWASVKEEIDKAHNGRQDA